MRNSLKGFIVGIVCTLLAMNSIVYAATNTSVIEVILNNINIALEGEVVSEKGQNYTLSSGEEVPFSIVYKGTTYLPMRKVAELLDKEVTWDGATKTAGLQSKSVAKEEKKEEVKEEVKQEVVKAEKIIDNAKKIEVKAEEKESESQEDTKESLDIVTIDGGYNDPYYLTAQQARVFVIAKTEEEFNSFKALKEVEKSAFLNKFVQENYGHYLGCSEVYADFIYDRQTYAQIKTKYDAKPEEVEIRVFEYGLVEVVLHQNIANNNATYEYYYKEDDTYKYPFELTEEDINEAMKEAKKGMDHVIDLEADKYTFNTEGKITDKLVVVTPYLYIMRNKSYTDYKNKEFTMDDAKKLYGYYDAFDDVSFVTTVYTDTKDGHKDLTIFLEQDGRVIDENSFYPDGIEDDGEYDEETKKYYKTISFDFSNMTSKVDGYEELDFSKPATFKIVLDGKEDVYELDFTGLK